MSLKLSENIELLLTDSRRLSTSANTCFFAIKTKLSDGHNYISQLIEKGVKEFVVEENFKTKDFKNVIFHRVKNTVSALQDIAAEHRKKFDIDVVAITGSNGKTIVKEWLSQFLETEHQVCKNYGSYNSQIGVPLSVWKLKKGDEIGIFEAGISQKDEMQNLEKIIQPNIGIFTNIGSAHEVNFQSQKEKIREKLKLFQHCNLLFYCKEHKEIGKEIQKYFKGKTIAWSNKDFNDFQFPFQDKISIENAKHCIAVAKYFDIKKENIEKILNNLHSIEMRLELKKGINNCTIINDSYSNDFTSLQVALDFANSQNKGDKITAIISDMKEQGLSSEILYQNIAKLLHQKNVVKIIAIGEKIAKFSDFFHCEKVFYPSTDVFIENFNFETLRNETILLKGARIYEFERINLLLQEKTHETVLEINFAAMKKNLDYFRSKLNPKTKIMAMVKAFSYGSGSYEIANFLQYNNVDYLAVAYPDEGIELRNFGIKMPIMVVNPEENALEKILRYDLETEIYSLRSLNLLIEEINKLETNRTVAIHLKVDTGMHRLGFEEKDIDILLDILKKNGKICVKSVFSHLVSAEDKNSDDFTLNQIKIFKEIAEKIEKNLSYEVIKHILNSAGTLRFAENQMDMVRLGIGLYGIAHNEEEQSNLQNVSTLKATVSQIKTLEKGDSVGYNRGYIAKHSHKSATVSIGYADGLRRELGNGKLSVKINDKEYPIIGKICMDMCMLEVSEDVKEGDKVIIFDSAETIKNLANICDTIPYEILTGISQRVKRVYFQE